MRQPPSTDCRSRAIANCEHPLMRLAVLSLAIGIVLSVSIGCSSKGEVAKQTRVGDVGRLDSDRLDLVYAAAPVQRGEKISHVFRFENGLDCRISIPGERAIRKGCGCTSIEVSPRSVGPGETSKITMVIDTRGRSGIQDIRATLTWKAEGSGDVVVGCRLKGEAVRPLKPLPEMVNFTEDDVRLGEKKHVEFSSPLSVDWRSLRVRSLSDSFSCDPVSISSNGASCEIGARPRDSRLEKIAGYLEVTARICMDAPIAAGREVSLYVKLVARRRVAITVMPVVVPIQFAGSSDHGTGRVLLRGTRIENAESIQGISHPDYRVQYVARDLPGDGVLVALTLTRTTRKSSDHSTELVVDMTSGDPLKIPIMAVR